MAGAGGRLDSQSRIPRALRAIRTHLGMDVAFVSEFVDGERFFRHVDTDLEASPVLVGASGPLADSYCQRVVDGRLPGLIPEAAAEPEAAALSATTALPVGALLSVPIRLKDGRVYGTFCCFSAAPDRTLTHRDLATMRIFAELTAQHLDDDLEVHQRACAVGDRLLRVIAGAGLSTALQPIIHLQQQTVVGWEALARFPHGTPDAWFKDAARVGLTVDLDLAIVLTALRDLPGVPEEAFLACNVTPATVTSHRLPSLLAGLDLRRVVLEITEHAAVESYEAIASIIDPLRREGLRLAVDDAGAGYASFRHILQLQPDYIKLDMSLTRDIDQDPARQALATALIRFAADTGSTVIAEGVETAMELQTLQDLGITLAQGYHLGRPQRAHEGSVRIGPSLALPAVAARMNLDVIGDSSSTDRHGLVEADGSARASHHDGGSR